jgi:hypothetical protein
MYPSERIVAGSKSTVATPRARWYLPMYQGFTYANSAIEAPENITSEQLINLSAPAASSSGAVNKIVGEKAYNQNKITTATAS